MTRVDENGQRVLAFTNRMRNLGRVAELTDIVAEMAASGAWRDYHTALGHETWREAELDYFLIACDLSWDDARNVFAWNAKAKELASMMDPKAPAEARRPIEQAANGWHSADGRSLVDRAKDLGWLRDNGVLRASPIPPRARSNAKHGVTFEEHARQERIKRIPVKRRRELDAIAKTVCDQVIDEQERRYVVEQLVRDTVGRPVTGAAELAAWRTDAERLNWDTKALAQQWGISVSQTYRRLQRLREGSRS